MLEVVGLGDETEFAKYSRMRWQCAKALKRKTCLGDR